MSTGDDVKKVKQSKRGRLMSTFISDGAAYDLVALNNGDLRFIRFKDGLQEIEEYFEVEIEGEVFTPPARRASDLGLIVASGPGNVRKPMELLQDIGNFLDKVAVLPTIEDRIYLCSFIFATFTFDEYRSTSLLGALGNPGVGKSTLLEAASLVSFNAVLGGGSDTESALTRVIDAVKGTVFIDESQRDATSSASYIHKLYTLGTDKKGAVTKCTRKKDSGPWEMERLSVFGPKFLAARSLGQDGAIMSRTYQIRLSTLTADAVSHLRPLDDQGLLLEADGIRNDLLLYRRMRRTGASTAPDIFNRNWLVGRALSPRDIQVNEWILKECPSNESLVTLLDAIEGQCERSMSERTGEFQYKVLAALHELIEREPGQVYLKTIAMVVSDWGYGHVDSRQVGRVLRNNQIEIRHTRLGDAVLVTIEQVDDLLTVLGYPSIEFAPRQARRQIIGL